MKMIRLNIALFMVFVLTSFNLPDPWKDAQLMAPETLANIINDTHATPILIVNIGPAGLIQRATDIGPMSDPSNVESLKNLLSKTDKSTAVVVYCGCCPFKNCPNIRPAFEMLKFYKFSKPYLLNLPHNLKVDWIDKGFPMSK